jgi:hypothetical protein
MLPRVSAPDNLTSASGRADMLDPGDSETHGDVQASRRSAETYEASK